jgi:hypothetical protein
MVQMWWRAITVVLSFKLKKKLNLKSIELGVVFTKGVLWWRLHSSFWWVVNTFPISIIWVQVFTNNKLWSPICNPHAQKTQHIGLWWVHWHLGFCKKHIRLNGFFVGRSEHQVKLVD